MLFVPAGLSGKCGGVFFQPAAMKVMLISYLGGVILQLFDHRASSYPRIMDRDRGPGPYPRTSRPVQYD